MSENDTKVILGQGVSLFKWIADLQSALVRTRCIGHVFHNIHGIKAVVCPVTPEKGSLSTEAYAVAVSEYEQELQKFQEGEIETRSILASRIERSICPPSLMTISAKSIFEHVLNVREEGANTHWETSVRELLMTKLRKPFEFDQAVGNSRLSYQGNCQAKIGNVSIELTNVLYSPESSCDIISAVRLKEDHGIVVANQMETLTRTYAAGLNEPIAKLKSVEGVLFIQEISESEIKRLPLAAPGVARIPNISSVQRWHERLGHIKTARSRGWPRIN